MCENGLTVVGRLSDFPLGFTEVDDEGNKLEVLCCPVCELPCVFIADDGSEYFWANIDGKLEEVWIT